MEQTAAMYKTLALLTDLLSGVGVLRPQVLIAPEYSRAFRGET
jgi:hypothetical protein